MSFRGRVSPRQATHFLLLRQKKVSKEKATLLSASALLGAARRDLERAVAALGSGTANTKTKSQYQATAGALRLRWLGGPAKQRPGRVPLPSGCAEERSVSRIRARSCLSEASSARPRETRAPQVARSEAKGRRQWGRLSFAYFSLAKQRKVGRPPGRVPAPENNPSQPLKAYDCDPLRQTPSHPKPRRRQSQSP